MSALFILDRSKFISSTSATYFLFFALFLAALTYGFSALIEKEAPGVSRNNEGEILYVGVIEQDKVEQVIRLYQSGFE